MQNLITETSTNMDALLTGANQIFLQSLAHTLLLCIIITSNTNKTKHTHTLPVCGIASVSRTNLTVQHSSLEIKNELLMEIERAHNFKSVKNWD